MSLIVEQNLNKAKSLVRKGKALEALNLYNAIIEKFPDNKRAQFGIQQLKPSPQKIDTLLKYYNTGRYDEAEKLAISTTDQFPYHQFSWKILNAILIKTTKLSEAVVAGKRAILINPEDAEAHSNLGLTLKMQGNLEAAVKSFEQAINLKKENAEAFNDLGITLKELGRLEEAETSYRKAISYKSNFAEAYNNLSITLKELDRLDEAEASSRQAIVLKPDYANAYNNLGIALKEQDKLKEAEVRYKQAIELKPDYAEAHNNLGNTLKDLGRLDEAIDSYEQSIKLEPSFNTPKKNMIDCLTVHIPKTTTYYPILKVNNEIRKINIKVNDKNIISDDRVVKLIHQSLNILKNHNLNFGTELSQVYRRNEVFLNCKRHMSIFDQHNIIPQFCFGCFKVQVEPRTIIELIKLMMIFDQLKLKDNNNRKCMVELRPKIPGFYKGLIYCSSIEEANKIADNLNIIVKEKISSKLFAKVKRGCSEYPLSFPDYGETNKSNSPLMSYNEDWLTIEDIYDKKNPMRERTTVKESLSGLNLQDIIIIQNWIDYAIGIDDASVNLLGHHDLCNHKIFKLAKARNG